MKQLRKKTLAVMASLILFSPVLIAEQTEGEMQAQSCGGCHGTEGRLAIDRTFMPLAGLPAEQFVKAMQDFRDDKRPSTLMGSIATGYSDDEIQAMGEYYQNVGESENE